MSTAYFEILEDLEAPGRWHLNGLSDAQARRIDEREFAYGKMIDQNPTLKLYLANEDILIEAAEPLNVSVRYDGSPLDFTFAGLGAPVVTSRVAGIIRRYARSGVQWFPVRIDGHDQQYEILNVASTVDCIDLEKSKIDWWEKGNEVRPDLANSPRMVWKLIIDRHRTKRRNLLRPMGWERSLIVSGRLRNALVEAMVTGISFREVGETNGDRGTNGRGTNGDRSN